MRSKYANLLLVGLLALVFGNGACQSAESTYLDCSCCLGDEDVSVIPDIQVEVGDKPEPKVGQACEESDECALGLCLTTEFLQGLGVENELIEIPNGMCSTMACTDDDFCGPNGVCFNSAPFSGAPITICLPGCDEMFDCRWQEGYSCYSSPVDPDDPEAGVIEACLPDSLIVAIECDDGHCDGTEPAEGEEG